MPAPSPTDPPRPTAGRFGPDIYAGWRASSLGDITEALEYRLLLDLAGPLEGRTVLDVGCGDGTLLRHLHAHGAARVLGCDADRRMVTRAHAASVSQGMPLGVVAAQAQALPFPDDSVDLVTCITVLAFVPDPVAAVREMARVLRPGGRLIIGDLGKWSVWAARRRIRGWLGHPLWREARFRTAGRIAALPAAAGLAVDRVEGAIFFPPWTAAARRMAPADAWLGRHTTLGAAFIAVSARKEKATGW